VTHPRQFRGPSRKLSHIHGTRPNVYVRHRLFTWDSDAALRWPETEPTPSRIRRIAEVTALGHCHGTVPPVECQFAGNQEDLVPAGALMRQFRARPRRRDAHEPTRPPVFRVLPDMDRVVARTLASRSAHWGPGAGIGVDIQSVHGSRTRQHG